MISNSGYQLIGKTAYEMKMMINQKGKTTSETDISKFLYKIYEAGIFNDNDDIGGPESLRIWSPSEPTEFEDMCDPKDLDNDVHFHNPESWKSNTQIDSNGFRGFGGHD